MQRRYLFRGKRKDKSDEWRYGFLVITADNHYFIIPEKSGALHKSPYIPYRYEVIPETVGQFIGCCDINGKQLFEGDIVQTEGRGETFNYTINYDRDKAMYNLLSVWYLETIKIISNIHDSPALLKW